MKWLIRFCLTLLLVPVYATVAQNDQPTGTVFLVNHTAFNVEVYGADPDTPIVEEIAAFRRHVHFTDADLLTITMHERGRDFPIAPGITIEVQPDTVNYVVLHRLAGDLILTSFTPESIAGEPIDDATQSPWIYVNLLTTADAVDVYYDDEAVIEELGYGEVAVAFPPQSPFTEEMRDTATGEVIDRYDDLWGEPYVTLLDIRETEDDAYFIDIYDLTTTDIITYLTAFNELDVGGKTYTTYLELIEIAGLTGDLATAEDVNFLVPTDAAFAALPPGTLDALRDDPEQLRDLLQGHMFAFGQFADEVDGPRELDTLAGTILTHVFDEEAGVDTVNGVAWGGLFLLENEGRLVNMIPVDEVLLTE